MRKWVKRLFTKIYHTNFRKTFEYRTRGAGEIRSSIATKDESIFPGITTSYILWIRRSKYRLQLFIPLCYSPFSEEQTEY